MKPCKHRCSPCWTTPLSPGSTTASSATRCATTAVPPVCCWTAPPSRRTSRTWVASACRSRAASLPGSAGPSGSSPLPGLCTWATRRVSVMLLDLLQDYFKTGRLPNTETATDPSQEFRLSEAEIDALSSGQLRSWLDRLRGDALLNRLIADFQAGDASGSDDSLKTVLKEIQANFNGGLAGTNRSRSTWGTGALASAVTLKPGQKVEVPLHLGLVFPEPRGRARGGRPHVRELVQECRRGQPVPLRQLRDAPRRNREIRPHLARYDAGRAAGLRLVEPVGHARQETPGGARPGTSRSGKGWAAAG